MQGRKNMIKSLTSSDGRVVEDKAEMRTLMSDFYKNILTLGVQDMHNVLDQVPREVTLHLGDE
jgi:hypothetical protein